MPEKCEQVKQRWSLQQDARELATMLCGTPYSNEYVPTVSICVIASLYGVLCKTYLNCVENRRKLSMRPCFAIHFAMNGACNATLVIDNVLN